MGAHLNYRIAQPGPNQLIDLCGLGWCHGKIAWNLWFPSGKLIEEMFEDLFTSQIHKFGNVRTFVLMFEHCSALQEMFEHLFGW